MNFLRRSFRRRANTSSESSVDDADQSPPLLRQDERRVSRRNSPLLQAVLGTSATDLQAKGTETSLGKEVSCDNQEATLTLPSKSVNTMPQGQGNKWNVFLCHAMVGQSHCQRLRAVLEVEHGISVHNPNISQIDGKTPVHPDAEYHIEHSDVFAIFVTRNLFTIGACLSQICYAILQNKPVVVLFETDPDHDGIFSERTAKFLVPWEFENALTSLDWIPFRASDGYLDVSVNKVLEQLAMFHVFGTQLSPEHQHRVQRFDTPVVYLSHLSSNGQSQSSMIAAELKILYGIPCWIDTNVDLLTRDIVAEALGSTSSLLLFLTDGVLDSEWVQFELDLAISLRKNIILVHETLPEHGGCRVRELAAKAAGTRYAYLFDRYDSIPYYHRRRFRQVTYEYIVEAIAKGFREDFVGGSKEIWIRHDQQLPSTPIAERPDLFLSHLSANGSNQCGLMATELTYLYGVKCWWDQNLNQDLVAESILEGVRKSTAYLLFLTEGILGSRWVQLELREAIKYKKPILLVHETEVDFGGGVLDEIKVQAKETEFAQVFQDNDSIPFYHLHRFRMASYETIVSCLNRTNLYESEFTRK